MKCHRVQKNLSAYADEELGTKLRRKIAEHLTVCEKCSAELSRLEQVTEQTKKSLLRMTSEKTVPTALREGVTEIIQPLRFRRPVLLSVRQFAAAAAGIALASGLLVGLMQEWRFRSAQGALNRKIVQQEISLSLAGSGWKTARMQVAVADAKLSEMEEKLRLASAARMEKPEADEGTVSRPIWPPVLLSLQVPGAQGLLENGLFGRNAFRQDNVLWKKSLNRNRGERS